MSVVTGLTAARMIAIEEASVIDGNVVGDDLLLATFGGVIINAGNVRGATGAVGPTGPSGGLVVTETEVDFGATPLDSASFVITDAAVSATSKLIISLSGKAPTGKDADEIGMDAIHLFALPASGSFTLFVRGLEGYLSDKFKINYIVG